MSSISSYFVKEEKSKERSSSTILEIHLNIMALIIMIRNYYGKGREARKKKPIKIKNLSLTSDTSKCSLIQKYEWKRNETEEKKWTTCRLNISFFIWFEIVRGHYHVRSKLPQEATQSSTTEKSQWSLPHLVRSSLREDKAQSNHNSCLRAYRPRQSFLLEIFLFAQDISCLSPSISLLYQIEWILTWSPLRLMTIVTAYESLAHHNGTFPLLQKTHISSAKKSTIFILHILF